MSYPPRNFKWKQGMTDLSDWRGCERPARKAMEGRFVRLEPLSAARHGDGLFAASSVPDADGALRLAAGLSAGKPRGLPALARKGGGERRPDVLRGHRQGERAGRGAPDTDAHRRGQRRRRDRQHLLGPARSPARPRRPRRFYLFARHVFDDLGYRRYEWKCNNANAPSKQRGPALRHAGRGHLPPAHASSRAPTATRPGSP